MSKCMKCFSCTYCLQDCCSCLYSKQCKQLIGCMFCLPCWDAVCHNCHKYSPAGISCTTCLYCSKCREGSYTAYPCGCCGEDNFTLEISDNSLQINHYTNMSNEGKDSDVTMAASKHRHGNNQTGSPTVTKQPARVRFQLDQEEEHCDSASIQTAESEIQDSTATLPSHKDVVTESQGTNDTLIDTDLNTGESEGNKNFTENVKDEKSEEQNNVKVLDSDDSHMTNVFVTGFKQTSV